MPPSHLLISEFFLNATCCYFYTKYVLYFNNMSLLKFTHILKNLCSFFLLKMTGVFSIICLYWRYLLHHLMNEGIIYSCLSLLQNSHNDILISMFRCIFNMHTSTFIEVNVKYKVAYLVIQVRSD